MDRSRRTCCGWAVWGWAQGGGETGACGTINGRWWHGGARGRDRGLIVGGGAGGGLEGRNEGGGWAGGSPGEESVGGGYCLVDWRLGGGGGSERIDVCIWSRARAILYLRPSAPWFHDICSISYARSWQPLSLASFPRRQPIIFPSHGPIVQGCPHPASSSPCLRPRPCLPASASLLPLLHRPR